MKPDSYSFGRYLTARMRFPRLNQRLVNKAKQFITQKFKNGFVAVQVRHLSAKDYTLGGTYGHHEQVNEDKFIREIMALDRNKAIFFMTTNCDSKTVRTAESLGFDVICSHRDMEEMHPDENLVVSQIIASLAETYLGEELSTISQIVRRLRTEASWIVRPDPNFECTHAWCASKDISREF